MSGLFDIFGGFFLLLGALEFFYEYQKAVIRERKNQYLKR